MKRTVLGITIVWTLVLATVPQAQAASFMSINAGVTAAIICDNSSALGVASCTSNGFLTVLNSNVITFTGVRDGVSFGGGGITGVQLSGNSPGSPALAFVLDTKSSFMNLSGALRTLTIDFAQNNFTNPVGIGFLSASQTANWTTSGAGDSTAFTAWERNDNALIVPGPGGSGTTAAAPSCVSPGGLSLSCASETLNVPSSPSAPYALTGREIITMSNGDVASFTSTSTLSAAPIPQVPEPSSLTLLGTAIFLVAGREWRKRRK